MGMLDFAKDIGKKLFGRSDDDAAKTNAVQRHIDESLGSNDIKAEYRDGQVRLSGKADSAEQKEKATLLAGNVEGVGGVNADQLEAPEAVVVVQYYEVRSGDTLSRIAQHFYHDANAYDEIYDANREVIGDDADKIYPGQKLRIPERAAAA